MTEPGRSPWTFSLQTVVLLVGWAITGAGLYYGLSNKLERLTVQVEQQAMTIGTLSTHLEAAEVSGRAMERALIELTVTLRAKEILK